MRFVQWGSYEVSASVAGQMGTIPLAAHTVFMNTVSLWYMVPSGIAGACSTLVGNFLGANNVDDARTMVKMGAVADTSYVNDLLRVFVSDDRRLFE